MFLRNTITRSTGTYSENTEKLKNELERADAILIGAGAGLSASAGLTYSGERFNRYFADFRDKYGIRDMYSGGFYAYPSKEEYWAWWSRHIWYNRYDAAAGKAYLTLRKLLENRDFFVLTTNVDHQLQTAGFDKKRLFYMQGDYGLFQCSEPCCDKTFDNKRQVSEMLTAQKSMRIPTGLIPRCPVCGGAMTVNLRSDGRFVQDAGWYSACRNYEGFLKAHLGSRVLYLELGVGWNTPSVIKYPFWQLTAQNPRAVYASINTDDAVCPEELKDRSICINADIQTALASLL